MLELCGVCICWLNERTPRLPSPDQFPALPWYISCFCHMNRFHSVISDGDQNWHLSRIIIGLVLSWSYQSTAGKGAWSNVPSSGKDKLVQLPCPRAVLDGCILQSNHFGLSWYPAAQMVQTLISCLFQSRGFLITRWFLSGVLFCQTFWIEDISFGL